MTCGGNHPSRRDRYTPARSDGIKTHSPFILEQFRSGEGGGPLPWILYGNLSVFNESGVTRKWDRWRDVDRTWI